MRSSFQLLAVGGFLCACLLGCSKHVRNNPSPQGLSVRLVAEYTTQRGTAASFDPRSLKNRILLFEPWSTGATVIWQSQSHSGEPRELELLPDLPCAESVPPFMGLHFVPDTSYGLVRHCHSLYVVDLENRRVVKQLLDGQKRVLRSVSTCPQCEYVAVYSNRPDGTDYKVELFDRHTWRVHTAWAADISELQFTPDGRYLVANFFRGKPGEPPDLFADLCGMEILDPLSGAKVSGWSRNAQTETCPHSTFRLIPDTEYLAISDELSSRSIPVWDVKSGTIVRRILNNQDGRVSAPLAVSPGGEWVVARVADDPVEVLFNQDFKVWNMKTGHLVYESPRYLQLFSPRLGVPPVSFQFSPDGQYLLVNKYDHIRIYELRPSPPRGAAGPS